MSKIAIRKYENGRIPWNKGKQRSNETKEKISKTLKKYWEGR